MPSEIHVGNVNMGFRFTIKDENDAVVNLVGAGTKDIFFVKPNGTKLTKAANFYTNGADGIIQYPTASGDLDTEGWWRAQGYVHLGASGAFYSDIYRFKVMPNL